MAKSNVIPSNNQKGGGECTSIYRIGAAWVYTDATASLSSNYNYAQILFSVK